MEILKECLVDEIKEMEYVKGKESVKSSKITCCIVIIGLNTERKINAAHLVVTSTMVNLYAVLDELSELFSGCSNISVIGQLDYWEEYILNSIYNRILVTRVCNISKGEYIVSANVLSDSLKVYVAGETVTFEKRSGEC